MPLVPCFFRLRLDLPAYLVAGLLGLTSTVAGAETYSPILVETKGSGPREQIVRFKVNPLARFHPLDRQVTLAAPVRAAMDAAQSDARGVLQAAEDEAFAQGLSVFSFALGLGGTATTLGDTFASSAAISSVYSNLGTGLTYLGLALTVYQISLGPASGDGRPEILNAYKGVSSYLLGRFGTPGIQLAMLAALPIDISLSFFGEGAWSAREDAWRQSYRKYYREMETSAQNSYYGSVGRFPPTLEERVAEIRARTEGGRTINEWKLVLAWYLDNMNRPEAFSRVLETEVRNYVALFWGSARFSEYAADVDQATAGYARGASLTQEIKKKLEDEHYSIVMAKLMRDVLPEIARDRYLDGLKDQVAVLNRNVRPELNAPLRLEVAAFGLDGPTKFRMLLAGGDTWTGTLKPGEPMRIALTKLAWFKAGFPDTLRLDRAEGAVERRFVFEEDEALVVFGTPETRGDISSFERKEGPQTCTVTTSRDGRPAPETRQERPAHRGETLQMGFSPAGYGYLLVGRFDGAEWTTAAPGRVLGGSRDLPDARLALSVGDAIFAAPYFESIIAITDCKATENELVTDMLVPQLSCRVHRLYRDHDERGKTRLSRCTAEMRLELAGVWTELEGSRQYVPFDRGQLQSIGREYENMLKRLPGAGTQ